MSILTYGDPLQGFPGKEYSREVYRSILLEAPWDYASICCG